MEIIKHGSLPGERLWRGQCYVCGTIMLALQKELKITSDQRDGDFGEANCEICGVRTIFYETKKTAADKQIGE